MMITPTAPPIKLPIFSKVTVEGLGTLMEPPVAANAGEATINAKGSSDTRHYYQGTGHEKETSKKHGNRREVISQFFLKHRISTQYQSLSNDRRDI